MCTDRTLSEWGVTMNHKHLLSCTIGILSAALLATSTAVGAEVSDNFESDTLGTLNGVRAWTAQEDDSAIVTGLVYTYTNTAYPIPGAHTKVVQLDGLLTNDTTSLANEVTWYDFMLQPTHWTDEELPSVETNEVKMAFYVDTNGFINILHWGNWYQNGGETNWTTLSHTPIGSNDWIRITIQSLNFVDDYTFDPGFGSWAWNKNWWRIGLNGEWLTHPLGFSNVVDGIIMTQTLIDDGTNGPWFASDNGVNESNRSFVASGTGYLDDFLFTTNEVTLGAGGGDPTFTITVTQNPNGTITPGTQSGITNGQDVAFAITPSAFYTVADVLIGGLSQGAMTNYTFTNVMASSSIEATYTEALATNGTPHIWLNTFVPGASNDWDAAEASDADGDGLNTGQEYLAGTDPDDGSSVFRIIDVEHINGTNCITFVGGATSTNLGPLILEHRVTLTSNWTNVDDVFPRSSTGTNIIYHANTNGGYYRVMTTGMLP